MITIEVKNVPGRDVIRQALHCLEVCEAIEEHASKEKCCLDMSGLEWFDPLTALMISNKIVEKDTFLKNLDIILPKDRGVKSYSSTIGFPLGKKGTGKTYSPLNHFSSDPQKAGDEVFSVIDRAFPEQVKGDILKVLIAELADNIDQHSKYKNGTIMAQYYPKLGFIGVGVVDNGVSIPGNFEAHGIPFETDAEAIVRAVHGESTKNEQGRGRGLFQSKKIVNEGLKGELYLISGKGALATGQKESETLYTFKDKFMKGTVVYAKFIVPQKKVEWTKYV